MGSVQGQSPGPGRPGQGRSDSAWWRVAGRWHEVACSPRVPLKEVAGGGGGWWPQGFLPGQAPGGACVCGGARLPWATCLSLKSP